MYVVPSLTDVTENYFSVKDIVVPVELKEKYEQLKKTEGMKLNRKRRTAPYSKNMIAKTVHKNPEMVGHVEHLSSNKMLFTFDFADRLPVGSEVMLAEFKIYKERPNESRHHRTQGNASTHHNVYQSVINVQQILDNRGGGENFTESDVVTVDSRVLPLNTSGWKIFDVTKTVQYWIDNPNLNFGLQFEILPTNPTEHAQRIADRTRFGPQDSPDTTSGLPILVVYTIKRAPKNEPQHSDCVDGLETNTCCRRPKFIDFRGTEWSDRWIIEPQGYDAFECVGPCTAHRVRNGRDLLDMLRTPRTVSCKPSRTSPLPMMYMVNRDGAAEIVVESIPNMIIQECQCRL
ncbi:left-right determination factor 1-like [Antedon mediterranea]|uniref:left-right determination factor 1-like n=1 Tax=Antedon mediterranea TaxID=105859 RepID=UPI003AF74B66